MKKITFGTDGWRGLIADDFTYQNVEICGWSIASYIKESLINERGVVVGYDTRFGSKEFAIQISNIFLSVRYFSRLVYIYFFLSFFPANKIKNVHLN